MLPLWNTKKKRSSCWYLTPSKSSLHLYPVDTGLCSCILKIPAFQLLSGEETTAGTACIETFLAQHFIRNGYALSYWSSGNQAEVPFLLSKNSHFIAIDYRSTPHQKCRNLMQLNKSSLSCTHANVFNLCRRLQAKRSLSNRAFICGILHIEHDSYNRQKQTPAGSSSRFHIFGNEEKHLQPYLSDMAENFLRIVKALPDRVFHLPVFFYIIDSLFPVTGKIHS